jgi:hypothetical protein
MFDLEIIDYHHALPSCPCMWEYVGILNTRGGRDTMIQTLVMSQMNYGEAEVSDCFHRTLHEVSFLR